MISNRTKKHYSLPLAGTTGLTRRQERILSYGDTTPGRLAGLEMEERFMEAWADPRTYPEWLVWVRRATVQEDLYKKTDAVMWVIDGSTLRIQIKRSGTIARPEHYTRHGVILVKIDPRERSCDIRHKTIGAIAHHWQTKRPKQYHFFSL